MRVSGLSREQIQRVATIYMKASAVIVCYGMGITQHRHGSENIQQIANLLLLRGNFGRPGAGICPVRGHSNVQGDRTVGIDEKPKPELLDQIERVFGFKPPRAHGHSVIDAVQAMIDGRAKVFIGLGGNFVAAVPDKPIAEAGMRRMRLTDFRYLLGGRTRPADACTIDMLSSTVIDWRPPFWMSMSLLARHGRI